jgi:outer membrane lipoprotein-sorting protein
MRRLLTAVVAGTAALGLVLAPAVARAQDQKRAAPANPVGAANPSWTGIVLPQQAGNGQMLDEKQVAIINRVSLYFNELNDLKGLFVQTDSDKRQFKGRFYVKRPGRFRFDYSAPNRKVVISDGEYLAIQEFDLNHEDIVELDQTPFRLLLGKDVDLMRDARIVDVQESQDLLVLALQDKTPDALGRLTLYLTKKPTLDLKEWVTTDAQGLNTRVEVSDLVKSDNLDANLFRRKSPTLRDVR